MAKYPQIVSKVCLEVIKLPNTSEQSITDDWFYDIDHLQQDAVRANRLLFSQSFWFKLFVTFLFSPHQLELS